MLSHSPEMRGLDQNRQSQTNKRTNAEPPPPPPDSMPLSDARRPSLTKTLSTCRHDIFGQFLSLIAGAGAQHTGVKPEDFTEEMMVSLPMDNYDDLKASKPAEQQPAR